MVIACMALHMLWLTVQHTSIPVFPMDILRLLTVNGCWEIEFICPRWHRHWKVVRIPVNNLVSMLMVTAQLNSMGH